MDIKPISIRYNYKNVIQKNLNGVSNPIYLQKNSEDNSKFRISFYGLIPNSELLQKGYCPAKVENNKIMNNDSSIIITSADKFIALTNSPNIWNKKIVLADDIDLNGAKIKTIGNASKPFKGEFDGNGCKISNFVIDNPESRNVGLFGKCENAKISNLTVEKAFIKGKQQVGGIAGYAGNSIFSNNAFSGYVNGEKKIGGLIGLSKQNTLNDCCSAGTLKICDNSYNGGMFEEGSQNFSTACIAGGLIGADEESSILNSYSKSTVFSNEQAGGIVGYAEKTSLKNCDYNGQIVGENKAGGLIGWGNFTDIDSSYAMSNKNNLIGEDLNSNINQSYSNLADIIKEPSKYWDSNIWTLNEGRLPRLVMQVKNMSAEQLFLEDVNTDIKSGRISCIKQFDNKVQEEIKINLAPPKHYSENDELLDKINNSTNNNFLRFTFGCIVSGMYFNDLLGKNSTDRYDELLAALVKNKHMDINTPYERETDDLEDGRWYNIHCNPLFILTCMNKANVLREALKRDDADFTVTSGYKGKETILKQALTHHIDECAYVLLTEPKMRNYIDERLDNIKAENLSALGKLLIECYPDNIPQYNEDSGTIKFNREFDYPKELLEPIHEVKTLKEAQMTGFLDANYKDSEGNNIVNVASTLKKPEESLSILIAAKKLGTDINNWNKKSESPTGHGIYMNNPHFVAQILNETSTPFVRIDDGTDAMLLFSKMADENYSVNYMDIASQRGLSVNTSDKQGNTPLINAITSRHYDAIKYLLSKGADPNQPDLARQTPLHHACNIGDINIINMLLDSYAYPMVKDSNNNMPFDFLDVDTKNLINDKLEDLQVLYKNSGICNDIVINPINYNLDNYEELYSLNEISNKIYSGNKADKEILQLTKNIILNQRAQFLTDEEGNSPLHIAASSTSPFAKECLKIALNKGFDINKMNNNQKTPLMSSVEAYLGADSIEEKIILMQNIKLLLDNAPNVDLTDDNEQSVLHLVCQSGNLILFNELLKLNPKINQIDKNGNTPFEYIPKDVDEAMYITAKEYLKNNKIIKGE